MGTETTEWNISTDIYNIVNSINNLKKQYIEDEDETTLALGIYGFITDTEAKKIQTSTIMTGELGNEMFPARANLTKNVLAHAIYSNIEDINAVPAHITLNIGIKIEDLDAYMINNRFIFDHMSPIFIGDYEFHFDYDIIMDRYETNPGEFTYSAHYDMTIENRISNITDPYLKQPFVFKLENSTYVIFQAIVHQVTIEETTDKIVSESIIENKTYTFDFDNQLADFDVYITDNSTNETKKLKPILYGSSTEGISDYCWYLYISDNTIRITFDTKSYIPGLNSDIYIKTYTTLGTNGIFKYKKMDEDNDGIFMDFSSETYDYSSINCYVVAVTDSTDGTNRKTKKELQKLIPKAALSRGSITTETDVNNYFNLINTEQNRLVMQKKIDNQLARVWYGYFLLKDEYNNIIPTNTCKIHLNTNNGMYCCEDGRWILPAGSIVKYTTKDQIAEVIDESEVPDIFSHEYYDDNYYYMTVYNTIINCEPLYAAYFKTTVNKDSFFEFNWINESSLMQFVANRCNFQRNLLTDQSSYKFTFKTAQSILEDYGLYSEEEVIEKDSNGEEFISTIITNNIKCILVLYKEGAPYRWIEAKLVDFNKNKYIYSWEVNLETDNGLDDTNNLKIKNLHVFGKSTDINYGYFPATTQASIYTLAKFDDGEFGRYDLDQIAPGYDGWTVTNKYNVESGLELYENFTNVLNTKIVATEETTDDFTVTGIPLVGFHYMRDEEHAGYLMDAISEKKAYIEYCLTLLENSMNVDFKFFNTYGPSLIYHIGDRQKTPIGHVDLELKFRVSLKNTADAYTKDKIIGEIKDYIEDLYETDDWHAPGLITKLYEEFSSRINFIEFMNYNNFWLGVQHIIKTDDMEDPHVVPEFLNVRNRYNIEGNLEPCIDVEVC